MIFVKLIKEIDDKEREGRWIYGLFIFGLILLYEQYYIWSEFE